MKPALVSLVTLALATLVAACASPSPSVPGLAPGKFATAGCAENKTFQLRLSDSGSSVRVRAHHGSAELDAQGAGVYAGEGYVLRLQGEDAISLQHNGKVQARLCRIAG
jgi:hypothetical protein